MNRKFAKIIHLVSKKSPLEPNLGRQSGYNFFFFSVADIAQVLWKRQLKKCLIYCPPKTGLHCKEFQISTCLW